MGVERLVAWGEYTKALAIYRREAGSDSASWGPQVSLALEFIRQRLRDDAALQVFKELIPFSHHIPQWEEMQEYLVCSAPGDPELQDEKEAVITRYKQQAEKAMDQGEWERVLDRCEGLRVLGAPHEELRARALYKLGRKECLKLLAARGDWLNLARAALHLGCYQQAIEAAQTLGGVEGRRLELKALIASGNLLAALKRLDGLPEAPLLQAALALRLGQSAPPPCNPGTWARYFRGLLALRNGEYEKAVREFNPLISMGAQLRYHRGIALLKLGRLKSALLDLGASRELGPPVANALAYLYHHLRKTPEFLQALQGIPDFQWPLYQVEEKHRAHALALLADGDWQGVIEDPRLAQGLGVEIGLVRVLEAYQKGGQALEVQEWRFLALIYERQEAWGQALRAWDRVWQALEKSERPDLLLALVRRGIMIAHLDGSEMIQVFRDRGLALLDRHPERGLDRVEILWAAGEVEAAVECLLSLDDCPGLDQAQDHYHRELTRMVSECQEAGEWEQALQGLELITALTGERPGESCAQVLLQMARAERSSSVYAMAWEAMPEGDLGHEIAHEWVEGALQGAREVLEEAEGSLGEYRLEMLAQELSSLPQVEAWEAERREILRQIDERLEGGRACG